MRSTNNIFIGDEYHLRFGLFLATKNYVNQFNRNSNSFKLAINKFACHTTTEIKSILRIRTPFTLKGRQISPKHKITEVPDSFDYREKVYVSKIKDQSACGGCCSFSAIQVHETTDAIHTGKLVSLSEANLIVCANIVLDAVEATSLTIHFDHSKKNAILIQNNITHQSPM